MYKLYDRFISKKISSALIKIVNMNRYLRCNRDFIMYKNTECTIKKRNNIDQTENKHLKYTNIIINNVSSLGSKKNMHDFR